MRPSRICQCLLVSFLCVTAAQAQSSDWSVIKQLVPGTPISVKYGRFWIHNRCVFESATDDTLVCGRILYGYSQVFIPPEADYRRKSVREVRLEHSDASNIMLGALIGGALGGALGAARSGDTHTQARVQPWSYRGFRRRAPWGSDWQRLSCLSRQGDLQAIALDRGHSLPVQESVDAMNPY